VAGESPYPSFCHPMIRPSWRVGSSPLRAEVEVGAASAPVGIPPGRHQASLEPWRGAGERELPRSWEPGEALPGGHRASMAK